METKYFVIYIISTLILAIYLTAKSKTNHKFVTFIITYWLFAGSPLNTEVFILDIKGWYFDIQPARLILILFVIYLIIVCGLRKRREKYNTNNANTAFRLNNIDAGHKNNLNDTKSINPSFEKCLYIFLALYLIADLTHVGRTLTMREIIASYTNLLVFPIIYLTLKIRSDLSMIKVFLRSLLIVCVLTSIVGIIQFFIDPYFLRIGTAFIAFGDQLRANGIYRIEFLQGSFLLAGVIVTLVIVRSNIFKFSMILLFLVGIVLTFHRVTWIITLIVFLLYFIKLKKLKVWQIITLLVFMGTIVYTYLQISPDLIDGFTDNPFVADRLTADSWTDRFGLYNMALKKIPQYFLFGVGSPRSEEYFHGVLSAGGSYEVALGKVGGIHNLYLLIAFFHGVPTAIFFTIFCITCFIFLWRKISITGKYFFMPAMVVLMYILQNLLNMFYLYNDLGLLLAMFLGMAVAVYKSNNISSNIILNNSSTNK